jgi:hypothetical protein
MTVQIMPFGSRKHNVLRLPPFLIFFALRIVVLLFRLFWQTKRLAVAHNWTIGTGQVSDDPVMLSVVLGFSGL